MLLLLITIFSFFFRFYLSWQYPPLSWDEAALGYNAFSILKTGKDEYGQFLPLIFKSFGDYKPGLYVYLIVPFITVFGLNEISVRLPSIILGSFTPFLIYLLINAISPKQKNLGLIAAIILACNPYNLHFSKTAWETNILTFELLLASYFFFKNKPFVSSVILGLGLYTYQAGKLICPFLMLILSSLNVKKILTRSCLSFYLPFLVLSLPLAFGLLFGNDSNRLKVTSLFSYPRSQTENQQIISETNKLDYLVFHHPYIFYLRQAITRYLNNFSARYLIIDGDWQNPRHSPPYHGVILFPSLFFLIIGLLFSDYRTHITRFFFLWLIIAPVPASLTRDLIQPVRSMSFSIPLVYFISFGIYLFLKHFSYKPKLILSTIIIGIYFVSYIYYLDLYYNHMVSLHPVDFLYGYKQAINYVLKNKDQYSRVYFSNYYQQPYIYYLFYSQYPPKDYQAENSLTISGPDTGSVESIGNINFLPIPYEAIKNKTDVLAIFTNEDINRQLIDRNSLEFKTKFIPLSPTGSYSSFYAYHN